MARLRMWKNLSILIALALVLALAAVVVPMAGTVEANTVMPDEVWVDDSWNSQADVDAYDPTLTWQYDAFAIIQDGIDNVAEDGTVHVCPGKYNETLLINKSLTLQSTDGWQNTNIDPAMDSIIRIEGDVDVTVQGFEITAGSWGIYIGEVFSTVNILDCFIHDNDSDGIRVVSGGDVLNIERNIIANNGWVANGQGVYIQQAWTTVNIRNNYIGAWAGLDSPTSTINLPGNSGDGIRIDDVPVGSDVTIEDNLIVENGDDGIDFPSVTSVHGSVDIKDNVIGAWVYDLDMPYIFKGNGDHGIHVAHVADTGSINIEGNAISQNGNDGINFGFGANAIFGTVRILQNFIGGWTCYPGDYGHSGDPQRYTGNYGEGIFIYEVGASGTVTIEHNKISENGYDTGIYITNIYGEVTIADNHIGAWEDSHGEAYLGNAGDGIYIYWVYPGAVLTIGPDNRIKENTENGIEIFNSEFPDTTTITIHHNTIHKNGSNGIELGTPCQVDGATISHNTVTNHLIGIYLTGPSDQNIISDNEIRNNIDGIVVEGGANQILRNNILNNQGGGGSGIHLVGSHYWPTSGNVIYCNNIVGNLPYGVCYEIANTNGMTRGVYSENADEAVDATGNWWGCIEGPGAAGCDLVFGNVIYDPWLPDEFQNCRECREAPPPPGVPTVNHWGIVAMITLFTGLLVWTVRRRRLAS